MTNSVRSCPVCQSSSNREHTVLAGSYIICDNCGTMLACRANPDAAPTYLSTSEQIESWARIRSGVRPGAEAVHSSYDEPYLGDFFVLYPPKSVDEKTQ